MKMSNFERKYPPGYRRKICIGKTKSTNEKGLLKFPFKRWWKRKEDFLKSTNAAVYFCFELALLLIATSDWSATRPPGLSARKLIVPEICTHWDNVVCCRRLPSKYTFYFVMEGDESIAIILRNRWSKLKCLWLRWWSRPKRETFSAFRGRWQIFRLSNTCTLSSKKNSSWSKKRMMSSCWIAHALISQQCACVGAPYGFHDCVL